MLSAKSNTKHGSYAFFTRSWLLGWHHSLIVGWEEKFVKQLPLSIGPRSVRKISVFSAFDIDAPFWQRGPIGHVGLDEAGLVHVVVEVHVVGGRHDKAFAHEPGGIIPEAGVLGTLRQQNFKVFGLAFHKMHKMI